MQLVIRLAADENFNNAIVRGLRLAAIRVWTSYAFKS